MQILGMDIGHSAVKIAMTNAAGTPVRAIFPSVVCPAVEISDDAERSRASQEAVHVDGRSYFIGETATLQGRRSAVTGLNEHWISSPEYAALLLGAWRSAARLVGAPLADPMLVMGLPTHLFTRQRDALKQIVARHLPVKAINLRVMPQSIAPYQLAMFTPAGTPLPDRQMGQESWGVVEVGYFTSDFCLVQDGRWIEKASGTCPGVRVAAEYLVRQIARRDLTVSLLEAEEALARGEIRHFGKRLDVRPERELAVRMVIDEVVDTATRLLGSYVRSLDGVIVAGGGGELVFAELQKRWPVCQLAENPRFAVAEGMRRFGAAFAGVWHPAAASG